MELTDEQRAYSKNAIQEIKSFLIDPTEAANYPIEGQIADQFLQNKDLFEQTAKEWVKKYANEEIKEVRNIINSITSCMV